jgi:acid phosphatase family membrane protein YuiD
MSAVLAGSADPSDLLAVLDNGALWWGLAACGSAQLSKLFIELAVHRRWNPKVLVETGGMPSSHSALLTGTTACLGWQQGFESPLFALAATLCFVVLYDAAGVRRAAGLTAARVNALPATLWPSSEAAPLKPLKENLGHTRLEVLVGSLMGPLVALPGLVWVGSPLLLAQHWGLLPVG